MQKSSAFIFFVTSLLFQAQGNQSKKCDLFKGSWVLDNSYPLYNASSCPLLSPSLNCQKNGRPDKLYMRYRWKPLTCHLSRFDGKDLLQKFRRKKILFVGDSLSSNQWESLACMLHSSVPHSNYTIQTSRTLSKIFFPDISMIPVQQFDHANAPKEYQVSIMYSKNGFLVDLELTERHGRVLNLHSISRTSYWKTADVVIFNSYHWWTHSGKYQTWDYFQVGDKIVKNMDHMEAYKIGLSTWSKWVDSNINFRKTKVFFQGISADHNHGKLWGEPKVDNCRGQTKPISGSSYPGQRYPGEAVVKNVLRNMKNNITLLDITLLTQLRKDGHPSVFGRRSADCSHWCLAGVPDAWNEILYTILLRS